MSLNVQEIKGFRAADKSYKKYDSRGLLLLVKPNGSKLWYFKYRFGGKEKKLPIGAFPEVSLSQARQLRDRARLKVSDGIDPMLERKRKKARIKLGAENTFAFKLPVANERDIAVHLLDRMLIVFAEIPGDADQARPGPIDGFGRVLAELFQHEPFEVLAVSHQPVEVEQALIDHVLV
ncbi:Arm DNA-binding domain-containing protein [Qipengyuania flava]|nr:Arm DNA-binding domain-containing protein [Qipengyuania flava]MBY5966836.1 Arm DNA-binding domain-containing protein [Qipengyuania flava]MBY6013160.1 Arm DNA-binding domain-containing protein [Qipengyuania flava]MBY6027602.1 Arm DNA-binding domain-containing protein [Qipengyuania flava]